MDRYVSVRIAAVIVVAFVLIVAPMVARGQAGVDPVNSINPLFFEDAFLGGFGSPPHPTSLPADAGNGWAEVETGGGTVEIRDNCGFRESAVLGVKVPCFFVRELLLGGLSGAGSKNITQADEFSWGFLVNVTSFRATLATKRMFVYGSSNQVIGSLGIYLGIAIEDDGSILVTSNIGPQDSGVDILTGRWYHFQLVMDGLTQKVYMNETGKPLELIKTTTVAGAFAGFSQWNIKVATGGSGVFKTTEFAVGIPAILTDPVTTGEAFVPYSYRLRTDANPVGITDFAVGQPLPDWLAFTKEPGASRNATLTSIDDPVQGVFPIELRTFNTAGTRWQNFTLTIAEGDIFIAWATAHYAAWVIFLAVLAMGVTIVLTLWRGAKGQIRDKRRRKRRRR